MGTMIGLATLPPSLCHVHHASQIKGVVVVFDMSTAEVVKHCLP